MGEIKNLKTRRARPRDVEAIIALWWEMMALHRRLDHRLRLAPSGKGAFREGLRNWITDDDFHVVVAETDGQVVGYGIATIRVNPPVLEPHFVGYINDLCVASSWRRRGIGRALVDEVKAWFRSRDICVSMLRALARNEDSQAFWRRMGWEDYMREMRREDPG